MYFLTKIVINKVYVNAKYIDMLREKGVRVARKSFTIIDEVHNWGDRS